MKNIFKILFLFVFIVAVMALIISNKPIEDSSLDMESKESNHILGEYENYIVYETNTKVFAMDTNKDKVIELFSKDEYTFQKLVDGSIYYTINPKFGDTTLTLKSMNTSGVQNKLVKNISLEEIDINDNYSVPEIFEFEVDDDNFYISYGYYDESTNIIQDSEILIFNKNDTEKEMVLDGYSKFEFYNSDTQKCLIAIPEEEGKERKFIDVQKFEETKLDE